MKRLMMTGWMALLLCPVWLSAADEKTPVPAKPTVAILDFDCSTSGHPELGKQISEAITALLTGEEGFSLVDRASLGKALTELQLNQSGLVSPEKATKIGQLVGAKILVTGKVFPLDKQLYVTAKLIGTETSLVDGVLVKGEQQADVGKLVSQLSEKIAGRLREVGPKLIAGDGNANDPVPALMAKLKKMKLPKVAVTITEKHVGPPASQRIDPAAETEMRSMLQQAGFTIVEGDEKELAKAGVDLVISGEAFSEFAARIGNLISCSARIEVKIKPRNGETVLFTDRDTARAADLSEGLAGKTALQTASRNVTVRVLEYFSKAPPLDKAKEDKPKEEKPKE